MSFASGISLKCYLNLGRSFGYSYINDSQIIGFESSETEHAPFIIIGCGLSLKMKDSKLITKHLVGADNSQFYLQDSEIKSTTFDSIVNSLLLTLEDSQVRCREISFLRHSYENNIGSIILTSSFFECDILEGMGDDGGGSITIKADNKSSFRSFDYVNRARISNIESTNDSSVIIDALENEDGNSSLGNITANYGSFVYVNKHCSISNPTCNPTANTLGNFRSFIGIEEFGTCDEGGSE